MSENNVQEVFGQFAVEINGEVQLFPTAEEATTAYNAEANAAGYLALATAFTTHKGLVAKNAVGKINIITEFLAFAEGYEAPAAGTVSEVAGTGEAVDPIADAAAVTF